MGIVLHKLRLRTGAGHAVVASAVTDRKCSLIVCVVSNEVSGILKIEPSFFRLHGSFMSVMLYCRHSLGPLLLPPKTTEAAWLDELKV